MATNDKYDRQLRLWGASGQRALGNTLVVLVGTSACGTETLKNLVLPGVGSILVVDDDDDDHDDHDDHDDDDGDAGDAVIISSATDDTARACREQLAYSLSKFASPSSNFFLPHRPPPRGDGGDDDDDDDPPPPASNAARACALLTELNPDVGGHHAAVPSLEDLDYDRFLARLARDPPPPTTPLSSSSSSSSSSPTTTTTATPRKILVVCADQPSSVFLPLSRACHARSIPLVVVRSYGLLGTVRVQIPMPCHPVVDARPSHRVPDLRLSATPIFDGLADVLRSSTDLDDVVDTRDRSHAPFVIILLQALEKWRRSGGGGGGGGGEDNDADRPSDVERRHRHPETGAEKEEFRTVVRGMARDPSREVNFAEALREAHLVWADGRVSEDVRAVLDRVEEGSFLRDAIRSKMDVEGGGEGGGGGSSSGLGPEVPPHVLQFQLLALALKRFLSSNDDYPPLEGTIPDMTSDTARYVALQEAYRRQAERDRSAVREIARSLLGECEQRRNGCDLRVAMPTDDEVHTFCKNSRYLRMLETRPLFYEYELQDPSSPVVASLAATLPSSSTSSLSSLLDDAPPENFGAIQSDARDDLLATSMEPHETDPAQTPVLWWIALRACDAFYDRHGHYPGKHDQELALEADANEVYGCMVRIADGMGLAESDLIKEHLLDAVRGKDLAREVVRYDEAEIHNVAAVVGGVASQEAVKLITGQYIPINDTYVYNGIASTAGVYRF
jgi:amyloid beta precursor protein binding protein 1